MIYALVAIPHIPFETLVSKHLVALALAAVLGGIIGIEREIKRRPAGLRTNMFICFGSALFTILSAELGGGGDWTRIASQIIPGIGFIGAGSILRSKGGVSGLTTAATIFVVAAVGMACGGGLYLLAGFSTVLIVLALIVLGQMETRFNLKPLRMSYSVVTGKSVDEIVDEINSTLKESGRELHNMRLSRTNGQRRVDFSVDATRSEHKALADRMRLSPDLRDYESVVESQDAS
ncbi:MAG: MgtC/SapB family protein [Acidobacteriia bacterium]|nr:MgtC/SapB family protein [Terriglobia bacterium]